MQKYFYTLLLYVLIGLLSLWHSAANTTLEDLVQQLTQISASQNIETSWVQETGQDIFLQSLQNLQGSRASSFLDAARRISGELNNQASIAGRSCSIDEKDVLNIISRNPKVYSTLYNTSNHSLSASDPTTNIRQACEKLFACMGDTRTISDESRELTLCQDILTTQFSFNQSVNQHHNTLRNINRNDNLYLDNIKDNGLFDIMIDIKNIENILFDANAWSFETIEMIYYALPEHIVPPSQQSSWSPWSTPNPWWGTTTSSPWSASPWLWWTTSSWDSSSSFNNPSWSQTNSTLTSEIESFVFEHSYIPQNSLPTTNYWAPQTTVSQLMCVPPQDSDWNGGSWSWSSSWSSSPWSFTQIQNPIGAWTINWSTNGSSDLEHLEDEIMQILEDYLETPGVLPWQNTIQFTNPWPIVPSAECRDICSDKEEGVDRLVCEGSCCMNSCEGIRDSVEQAICLSQCVCGETSSQNDILRIKICRVPAQASPVKAGKTIHSVEEAVNEINAIFSTLKHSWALIPRTKKQQFLDTSFSSLKMSEILAFDIFVSTKPIYNKIQTENIQQKINQNYQQKSSINNTSWKLGDPQDQNKYVSLVRNTSTQRHCKELWGYYNETTKECILQEHQETKNIEENYYNNLYRFSDDITDFLWQHSQLREELFKQFSEFKTISRSLKSKADAAQ